MSNRVKTHFLGQLRDRFGPLTKIAHSQSLFEVANGSARIYIRYSKKHGREQTFYGLRKVDLQLLEGSPAILCFLWEGQDEPLMVPFVEFEEVFNSVLPAGDGQYKVQVYEQSGGTELYIAKAGRFNVESYFGWTSLESLIDSSSMKIPDLSHSQIQTLLGSIGARKGFDIWVPMNDRSKMDWSLTQEFPCSNSLPLSLRSIKEIAEQIDTIWIEHGAGIARAFFEVEYSTPIYSGLLRLNDVYLLVPNLQARFGIVSNDAKRSIFVRQLHRPTFQTSSLSSLCTFLEYRNVFGWYQRIESKGE